MFLLYLIFPCRRLSTATVFPAGHEHHIGSRLFPSRSLVHQPTAEQVRRISVHPESHGDDDFKRVNIGIETVLQPDIAACLVIVQHIGPAYRLDRPRYRPHRHVEQFRYFPRRHPYLVTGYGHRPFLYDNDIPFHGCSSLNVTYCELFYLVQTCRQVFHVLVEFLFRDLGVYLRGLYALVPEHGADRLDGYAVGEEYRCRCRMAALVPREMLRDAAPFGDHTDSLQAGHIVGDGEYPAILAQPAVLVDDPHGDVQQPDIGHHTRFLAVDVYPLVLIEIGTDVLFTEVPHVGERQSRKGTEQVKVTVQLLLGVFQPAFHQQAQLLFREEAACRFFLPDFILAERVPREPFVVDGDEDHRPQRADVQPHGIGAAVLVRAQEHLEVGDESRGKLFQGDVLHMVADVKELLQVLVNDTVLLQCTFGFHACLHLFLIVLVVPAEHLHQRVVAVFQSEKGVFHLFRRDEVVTLHDFLIVPVDAHPHLVEHTVGFERRRASARDTSAFRVPQPGIDCEFATELGLAPVHRDASHDGNRPVLLHYLSFQVEDN